MKSFQCKESALNAQNGAVNSVASTQIKASVDLALVFDVEAVRDGVILHEESESEQESKPYRGDHSAAIDHSVRTTTLALAWDSPGTERSCRVHDVIAEA